MTKLGLRGGVVPTLNAFDCGDTRATVVIVMREREGKGGGGKGPLISDRSFTLSTTNFQIVFYGNRVGDIRVQDDKVNTLQARMGTGGGNMPLLAQVYPIDTRNALRNPEKKDEQNRQGLGVGEAGAPSPTLTDVFTPAIAFHQTQDPISGEVSPALGTTSKGMGVMSSTVRRLTPIECERLQGFPDGWTDGQADSHRYKQMGNAVAVPVVQWIVDRMTK